MSVATITAAQRQALRDTALALAVAAQEYAENGRTPTAAEVAAIQPVLDAAAVALQVAGSTGLPATSVVLSNGDSLPVQNSAGALTSTGTAIVAAGAVSGVRLVASKTILTSGTKVNAGTVTGTGNFATATIANGVITGITLTAS